MRLPRSRFVAALLLALSVATATTISAQPFSAQIQLAFQQLGLWPFGTYATGSVPQWNSTLNHFAPVAVPAGGVAPADATYITQTAHASLTAEQVLGALATGLMRSTTATGVVNTITSSIVGQVLTVTGADTFAFGTLSGASYPVDCTALTGIALTATPSLLGCVSGTAVTTLTGTAWTSTVPATATGLTINSAVGGPITSNTNQRLDIWSQRGMNILIDAINNNDNRTLSIFKFSPLTNGNQLVIFQENGNVVFNPFAAGSGAAYSVGLASGTVHAVSSGSALGAGAFIAEDASPWVGGVSGGGGQIGFRGLVDTASNNTGAVIKASKVNGTAANRLSNLIFYTNRGASGNDLQEAFRATTLGLAASMAYVTAPTDATAVDAGTVTRLRSSSTITPATGGAGNCAAAFAAAALTADCTIATLPAGMQLKQVYAEVTAGFTCSGTCTGTKVVQCGTAVAGVEVLAAGFTVAAAGVAGDADAELGSGLVRAAAIQAGLLGSWSATTPISCRFTSGTGNWGNGATTFVNAGSITFTLVTEQLK